MKKLMAVLFFSAGIHVFLGWGPIKGFSPTYDEAVHLTAGYVYWKTADFRYNSLDHTPLGEMWSAIPLLFLNPILPVQHPSWIAQRWTTREQFGFADEFIYQNRVPAERMLLWGRGMQLALSCFLGMAIVMTAFFLGGIGPAAFAAILWSFSPMFLTAGTLVTTDLAFALFFFGFFASLLHCKGRWGKVLAGICLGFCFGSKYFSLALLPIFLVVGLWDKIINRKIFDWRLFGWVILVGLFSLGLVYGYSFSGLRIFWRGLHLILARSQEGHQSFFAGRHGTQGWLLYFPFVFLVKTPIPLLIGLALAGWATIKKKLSLSAALWIPPLIFFGATCLSKVQIGHRHLLGVYPFVILIAALGVDSLGNRSKWMMCLLGLWLVIGTWRVRPDFIAYFNELVGGPANGYKYLTDSNVDWGQGLKKLGEELTEQERQSGIYLCYFGVADPHRYGIRYRGVGYNRLVERIDDSTFGIQPTTFAISVTNLQATYYPDRTVFDWLKNYSPSKIIGHSIFVYDFSKNPEAIDQLRRLQS